MMLRMPPRLTIPILAVLVPLGLAACADTLNSGKPLASNSELQRQYDKTLTKSERETAISDLEQEKRRQEQAVKQDDAATGAAASTASPTGGSN
jgi:hypothetical protein